MVDDREKLERLTGAYITKHAQKRIQSDRENLKRYEEKIINLEGPVFRDRSRNNYNIKIDGIVFAFEVTENTEKEGYFALVKTSFPRWYSLDRFRKKKFREINVDRSKAQKFSQEAQTQ